MSSKCLVDKSVLVNIADSIRDKCFISNKLSFPNEFESNLSRLLLSYFNRSMSNFHNTRITNVKNRAFYDFDYLRSIDLPEVVSVGGYAFYDCGALQSINLPKVLSVDSYAFCMCYGLQSISLPSVNTISNGSFSSCGNLLTVNLPSVTSIDSSVFSRCNKLSIVIIRSETLCTLNNANAFAKTPIASGTGYIYVPRDLVDSYKTASNWSTYANQFRAIEDYPEICGTEV